VPLQDVPFQDAAEPAPALMSYRSPQSLHRSGAWQQGSKVPAERPNCLQTTQPSCRTLAARIAIAWVVVAAADPKPERHFELPARQWARREPLGCSDWWLEIDFGWRRLWLPGHRPWAVLAAEVQAEVPAVRAKPP
jgi:hypothetical protein